MADLGERSERQGREFVEKTFNVLEIKQDPAEPETFAFLVDLTADAEEGKRMRCGLQSPAANASSTPFTKRDSGRNEEEVINLLAKFSRKSQEWTFWLRNNG